MSTILIQIRIIHEGENHILYQTSTIMEFLGVTRATVNRLEKIGKLKATKNVKTNRWIVEKEDLADFIVENEPYLTYFLRYPPSRRLQVAYMLLLNEVNYKLKMKEEVYIP